MIMKLIKQSRANGGKGKISKWTYDENTTTESGSRKKEARIEDRDGEGDKEEARGDCESESVNGKNTDGVAPEREGIRGGRNAATEGTKIDRKIIEDAMEGNSTQTSIAESADVALREDSQETNKKGQRGKEEPQAPGDRRNKINEIRPREAKGNAESAPSRPPAGNNGEGSKDQEMENNNAGGEVDREKGNNDTK